MSRQAYPKLSAEESKKRSAEATQRWRKRNPEKVREINRLSNLKRRDLRTPHRREIKNGSRWRIKGLIGTPPPKPALCEMNCGKPAYALDHNHSTGKIRGWLCNKCNVGIGMLGDTLEGALRAVEYLKERA